MVWYAQVDPPLPAAWQVAKDWQLEGVAAAGAQLPPTVTGMRLAAIVVVTWQVDPPFAAPVQAALDEHAVPSTGAQEADAAAVMVEVTEQEAALPEVTHEATWLEQTVP